MKLYIAVLDEVPDFIVPTLVAHSVLGAHLEYARQYIATEDYSQSVHEPYKTYLNWLENSFKKCVVRVYQKEFDKIAAIPGTYLGHENKTLGGIKSCAVPLPVPNDQLPNVLKFARLWKPRFNEYRRGCLECDEVREIQQKDKEWHEDVARGRELVRKLAIEQAERREGFDTLPDDYEVN